MFKPLLAALGRGRTYDCFLPPSTKGGDKKQVHAQDPGVIHRGKCAREGQK